MAKGKSLQGMNGGKNRKMRGHTSITGQTTRPNTHPMEQEIARNEASRPGPGKHMGKHRGDRRDTSPTYTTTVKHAAHGSSRRPDVSTRAR